jgi:hypothetical protein
MTYCCGILVRDDLVMFADTRTNAGVDNISTFRKLDHRHEQFRIRHQKAASKPRFQLSDGSVDLTKSFSLGGFEGVGGSWKLPPTDDTFDARYGRW